MGHWPMLAFLLQYLLFDSSEESTFWGIIFQFDMFIKRHYLLFGLCWLPSKLDLNSAYDSFR